MTFPFPTFSPSGVLANATISYRTNLGNSSDTTSFSFASTDIGTAASDRHVILAFMLDGPSSVTSVTIGGIAATQVILTGANGNNRVAIYIAPVPTGATATIAMTFPASSARMIAGVWAAYGLLSATPTDTAQSTADPAVLDLDVSAGGIAVGFTYNEGAVGVTWTGLTENFERNQETYGSGASGEFAVAQTGLSIRPNYASAFPNGTIAAAASFR